MKCLVCGKNFQGNICPRCEFPVVNFPGPLEEGIKNIQPEIMKYREKLLRPCQVGVTAYRWKDENGKIVLDQEERLPLGNGAELLEKEAWLPQKFARIPDAAELQVRVYIDNGKSRRETQVRLPNLMGAELQELGMKVTEVDKDLKLVLLLRGRTQGPVSSDGIALLEED